MSFQTLKMLKLVTAHISCIQQPELSHGGCVCDYAGQAEFYKTWRSKGNKIHEIVLLI